MKTDRKPTKYLCVIKCYLQFTHMQTMHAIVACNTIFNYDMKIKKVGHIIIIFNWRLRQSKCKLCLIFQHRLIFQKVFVLQFFCLNFRVWMSVVILFKLIFEHLNTSIFAWFSILAFVLKIVSLKALFILRTYVILIYTFCFYAHAYQNPCTDTGNYFLKEIGGMNFQYNHIDGNP